MRTDQELRQRSHAEFVLLGTLAPDDPRREEARDHLVALHLPLVKHLARRFGSRGEPVEDLTVCRGSRDRLPRIAVR